MKKLSFKVLFPKSLQWVLNISLVALSLVLTILMVKEIIIFADLLFFEHETKHTHEEFLANVLAFFLYFEFITMIVKYFKEDYHFPLRYFIYIGITAMIRLIILDHSSAKNMLMYGAVVLLLIIGYFIINITPLERPKRAYYELKQAKINADAYNKHEVKK